MERMWWWLSMAVRAVLEQPDELGIVEQRHVLAGTPDGRDTAAAINSTPH